jgi:Flp pilus assembly protein TadD
VYLSLDHADDSVTYLRRATDIDPNSWYAWLNLGIALDRQGQFKDAETAYRKSLELNSSQNSTLYNLASNLVTQGRGDEAVTWFEQLLKRDGSQVRYHKRYADALVVAKRYDDAIKQYQNALRMDPRYYPAMNELGLLLITQYKKEAELDDDKKRAAIDLWHQSLAIAPNQERVQGWLKEWNSGK